MTRTTQIYPHPAPTHKASHLCHTFFRKVLNTLFINAPSRSRYGITLFRRRRRSTSGIVRASATPSVTCVGGGSTLPVCGGEGRDFKTAKKPPGFEKYIILGGKCIFGKLGKIGDKHYVFCGKIDLGGPTFTVGKGGWERSTSEPEFRTRTRGFLLDLRTSDLFKFYYRRLHTKVNLWENLVFA